MDVRVELLNTENDAEPYSVVHFDEETEVIEATTDGTLVTFSTDGFSAYAIVQGPSAVPLGWTPVASLQELATLGAEGLYVGHKDGYYLTSGITNINSTRTGIIKTKPAKNYPPANAVLYYFEPVEGAANQYKIYCKSGDDKQYVIQSANSLNLTTEAQATVFTAEKHGNEPATFRLKGNDGYYWNMQGGAAGASFAAYQSANDDNAKLKFWYYITNDSDPYGMDGQSFGLMSWSGGVSGKAMMASSANAANALDALPLTVMTAKQDNDDKLFVPDDSDITTWTFHWVEADEYYLTTVVDGSTRYLRIAPDGLSLAAEPDEACRIKAVPGMGVHAGEICLQSNGVTLSYSESVAGGFTVNGSAGSEWLNLVEISELTSDYFMTYSASKVGVSEAGITNGSRIIVYTRAWNDTKKKYEFYAIDHDGSLMKCFESGDSIQWVGNRVNTLLWNLVEYYDEGTTNPTYFYELYNQYSEQFIAPQIAGNQLLSSEPIGINLNGRRNGSYYSSIVAWDNGSYAYAGLKVENGRVVACPLNEADDFYFAIMEDLNVDDTLTRVPTVDHTQYGITMKIKDFGTKTGGWNEQDNFLGSNDGGAVQYTQANLLSTALGEDGYPTNRSGESMGSLFAGGMEVNHLFIGSTYSGSGYFGFDSTQNYATLNNGTGDFTGYKELATMDENSRASLKHGQFMPFNDLTAGVYASVNSKNLYTATLSQLPNDDPRK